jgi:hypothetical protein
MIKRSLIALLFLFGLTSPAMGQTGPQQLHSSNSGSSGKVPSYDTAALFTWLTPITSISGPSILSWSGGTASYATGLTSNEYYVVAVNGSGAVGLYSLTSSYLPALYLGSGSHATSLSDVTLTSLTSGQQLQWNGSAWVNVTPSAGFSNPMTTLGDIIYENATPAAARLAGNTSSTNKFLTQTGTGSASAAPGWNTISQSDLPNPSSSGLGGVQSIAAISHNFLTSISTSGVPAQAQPAFTDISGTASAAQLPNPSASSLGGIQSLAAVTSKWINTISTSGVPSATQPAFTDISGTAVETQGGTHQSSYTTGDTLYASASNTLSKLAIGTTGQVLTVAAGLPTWAAAASSTSVLQYGSGIDGAVTISTNTTLTRDMYYSALTVNTGVVLNTSGYRVYVSGTLTLTGTAIISNNGGNASGTTGGSSAGTGNIGGGTAGGAGAASSLGGARGSAGTNGTGSGGAGGAGGTSNVNAGGAAGVLTLQALYTVTPNAFYGAGSLILGGTGGGGGSCGGANAGTGGAGGGGGASGGLVYVAAGTLAGSGTIEALGGNGAAGGNGAGSGAFGGGGGGAGGGGLVLVECGTNSSTITLSAAAGSAGTFGTGNFSGSAGSSGTAGKYILYVDSTATYTHN